MSAAVVWPLVEHEGTTRSAINAAPSEGVPAAAQEGAGGPSFMTSAVGEDTRDAVNRLTREHDFLRSKLRLLESALGMGQEAWFVMREVSFTLWKELQAHCRREEETLATCRATLGTGQWTPVMVDHVAEQGGLRSVKQLFMEKPRSFAAFRPRFAEIMAGLRRQMDQQEKALFPALKHFLTFHHPAAPKAQPAFLALTETMSVQQVINRHPTYAGNF